MRNSTNRSGGKPDFKGKKPRFSKQGERKEKPSYRKTEGKPGFKKTDTDKRTYSDKSRFAKKNADFNDKDEKKFNSSANKRSYGDKPRFVKKSGDFKDRRDKKFDSDSSKRGYGDKPRFNKKGADFNDKRERKFDSSSEKTGYKKSYKNKTGDGDKRSFDRSAKPFDKPYKPKPYKKKESGQRFGEAVSHRAHKEKHENKNTKTNSSGLIRLNKYLSNAGICSRREADELIKAGAVSVNGKVVTEMGFKVGPDDKINYGGETLRRERKIYVLLNKPKDYITTMDDPQARRTVMELVEDACRERLYPVGRLDRNTTGLLLFTNDGEVAAKLTHPKFGIKKVYHVTLNKNINPDDFKKLIDGIELEDGLIRPDDMSFINDSKKELGIEIHSGRNRIVRRIFEHLGYEVIKLDRTIFAGLTKKDLPRAKWRFLTPKEIAFLKMIG